MQTRRLRIAVTPGDKVTALLAMPTKPRDVGVLLAHGAGVGQRHSFMAAMRSGLASAGFPTLTFDYSYMEAGRRAPDRMPKLLATHAAAARRLESYVDTVVLAGKSMGGRVGSHLAGDEGYSAGSLVYFGYPLVPLGKGEPRPTDHLERIDSPQLFWAGTRDRLSPPPLVGKLVGALPAATLEIVDDADHGFHVPKRTGLTDEDVLERLVTGTARWIEAVAQIPGGGK